MGEMDKMAEPKHETAAEHKPPRLKFGHYSVPLPRSRTARIATGAALMVGGTFSFLPILGLWMLPAGALVLSADSAAVRRLRRRTEVWWGRRGTSRK
jgi:hypothetical protein